mgnify:FL=1
MEIFYKAIFISKILIIIPFILIVFLINKKYKEYKTFKENEDRTSLNETLESPIKRNKKPKIIRIRKR